MYFLVRCDRCAIKFRGHMTTLRQVRKGRAETFQLVEESVNRSDGIVTGYITIDIHEV